MGYREIKGIECVVCGEKFRWPDLPKENRINFLKGICKCPKCNTTIKVKIGKFNLMPLIFFEMVFLPLFLVSLDNWPLFVTVVLAAINFGALFYFKDHQHENEYMQTIRYNA